MKKRNNLYFSFYSHLMMMGSATYLSRQIWTVSHGIFIKKHTGKNTYTFALLYIYISSTMAAALNLEFCNCISYPTAIMLTSTDCLRINHFKITYLILFLCSLNQIYVYRYYIVVLMSRNINLVFRTNWKHWKKYFHNGPWH